MSALEVPGTSRALCQRGASDKPAVATRPLTDGAAKSQADGVIAGLTVALVQGGQPDALPMVLTSLKKAGAGLQEGLRRGFEVGFRRRRDKGPCRTHPEGADRANRERHLIGRQRVMDGSCREGQARIGDNQRTA